MEDLLCLSLRNLGLCLHGSIQWLEWAIPAQASIISYRQVIRLVLFLVGSFALGLRPELNTRSSNLLIKRSHDRNLASYESYLNLWQSTAYSNRI